MSAANIKVAIKARPLLKRERDSKLCSQWKIVDNSIQSLDSSAEPFYFDHIFDQDASNYVIFDTVVRPIVAASLQGFHGTIFAYGQTSSGKTYTMLGDDVNPGVIYFAAKEIFNQIEAAIDRNFLLRVGYIEIYNEKIYDLLNKTNQDLKIHENQNGDVTVNCMEQIITSVEEMMKFLQSGNKSRRIGETNMNERSSRSHAIFRIIIESRETNDKKTDDQSFQISILNLVDLAGSERADQTGATGSRLKEGGHINKSLLSLSCVISKLSEDESSAYINYRDSKLTRILQASLGGNALAAIICNINPTAADETNSTLNFAMRAKSIKNKPKVNEVVSDAAMMKRLEKEIARLMSELEVEKRKNSKIKIVQLEKQIKGETLKILHSTSKPFKENKTRRQTWCPSYSGTPEGKLEPNIHQVEGNTKTPPKFFTPLVTVREHCEEFFEPFFPSMNAVFDLKTPKQFKQNNTKIPDTPTLDPDQKCKLMEEQLEELQDFTNLEKALNVKYDINDALKKQVNELQIKITEYEKERLQFLLMQDDFKEQEQKIIKLNKTIDEEREKYDSLNAKMNDKEEELQTFRERCHVLETSNLQLSETTAAHTTREKIFQTEISRYKDKIKELQFNIDKLGSIEFELEQHNTRAKRRETELLEVLNEKNREITSLKTEMSSLKKMKPRFSEAIAEKKCFTVSFNHQEIQTDPIENNTEKNIEITTRMLKENKQILNKLQIEYDELSNQLMESIQDNESLKNQCSQLKEEICELKALNENEKIKENELMNQLNGRMKENESLRDQCSRLKEEISVLREKELNEYEKLKETQASGYFRDCVKENESLRDQCSRLEEICVLREKEFNEEEKLKETQASDHFRDCVKENESLRDQCSRLKEEICVLREKEFNEEEKLKETRASDHFRDCVKENESLRDQCSRLKEEICVLREKEFNEDEKLKETQASDHFTDCIKENESLKEQCKQLKEELCHLREKSVSENLKENELLKHLEDSTKENESLRDQCSQLKEEIFELKSGVLNRNEKVNDNQISKKENMDFTKENEGFKEQLKEEFCQLRGKSINEVLKQLSDSLEENKSIKDQCNQLKEELSALKEKSSKENELLNQLTHCKEEYETLKEECKELKEELRTLKEKSFNEDEKWEEKEAKEKIDQLKYSIKEELSELTKRSVNRNENLDDNQLSSQLIKSIKELNLKDEKLDQVNGELVLPLAVTKELMNNVNSCKIENNMVLGETDQIIKYELKYQDGNEFVGNLISQLDKLEGKYSNLEGEYDTFGNYLVNSNKIHENIVINSITKNENEVTDSNSQLCNFINSSIMPYKHRLNNLNHNLKALCSSLKDNISKSNDLSLERRISAKPIKVLLNNPLIRLSRNLSAFKNPIIFSLSEIDFTIQKLKATIEFLEEEKIDHKKEIEELNNNLKENEQNHNLQVKIISDELESIKNEKQDLLLKFEKLQEGKEMLEVQFNELKFTQSKLECHDQELKNDIEKHQLINEQLKSEISILSDKITLLTDKSLEVEQAKLLLECELNELKASKERNEPNITELINEVKELQSVNEQLSSEVTNLTTEVTCLNEKLSEVEKCKLMLKNQLSELECDKKQLESRAEEMQIIVIQNQSAHEQTNLKMQSLNDQLKQLADKLLELENVKLSLESQLIGLENEKNNLESRIQDMSKNNEQQQLLNEQLKYEISGLNTKVDDLTDKSLNLETVKLLLESQLNELNCNKGDLECRIKGMTSKIENLQSLNQGLKTEITSLNVKIADLTVESEELERSKLVLKEKLELNIRNYEVICAEKESISNELSKVLQQKEIFKDNNVKLEAELRLKNFEFESFQKELNEKLKASQAKLNQSEKEKELLEIRVQDNDVLIKQAEEECKSLRSSIALIQNELLNEKKSDALSQKNIALQDEINIWQQKYSDISSMFSEKSNQCDLYKNDITALENTNKNLEGKISEITNQVNKSKYLQDEINQWQEKYNEIFHQFNEKTRQLDLAYKENSELESTIKKLEGKLSNIKYDEILKQANQYKNDIFSLQNTNTELINKLSVHKKQSNMSIAEWEGKYNNVLNELEKQSQQCISHKKEISDLTNINKDLESKISDITALQTEINNWKDKYEKVKLLKGKYEEISSKLNEKTAECLFHKNKLVTLENVNKELESNVSMYKQKDNLMQEEFKKWKEKYEAIYNDLNKKNAEQVLYKNQITTLENIKNELEHNIATFKRNENVLLEEVKVLKEKHNKVENELKDKTNTLETTKKEVNQLKNKILEMTGKNPHAAYMSENRSGKLKTNSGLNLLRVRPGMTHNSSKSINLKLENHICNGESDRQLCMQRQELIDNLLQDNNQLKQKNEKLSEELHTTRTVSQQERKSRRQSFQDEKRLSLWGNSVDKGTMTLPVDKLCGCEQMSKMIDDLRNTVRIKDCHINTMLLESKLNPFKDENETLKHLLMNEEAENKRMTIEMSKLKRIIEINKYIERAKNSKKDQLTQTDEQLRSNQNLEEQLVKLQNNQEILKTICRNRKQKITELEEQIKQQKENRTNTKSMALSENNDSNTDIQKKYEILEKERDLLVKKYQEAKIICISRGEDILHLKEKLKEYKK